MDRIYTAPHITVSPFLIVPTFAADREANMVVGPVELKNQCDQLTQRIFTMTQRYFCVASVSLFWYGNKIVLAIRFASDIEDSRSQRKGLNLIYGVSIDPLTFRSMRNVCESSISHFNEYLSSQFNVPISRDGFNALIAKFQNPEPEIDQLVGIASVNRLLQQLESMYFNHDFQQNNWLSLVLRKLPVIRSPSQVNASKPCYQLSDVFDFLRRVDKHFNLVKNESEPCV